MSKTETLAKRVGIALVLALFSAPLFVGLGRTDVDNDEAIYSFAVDRILETGDWLTPKSSPSEDAAFLEKPPLKFWIVAAPIRLGVLPHNEFGIRAWDALFGAAAFLYVFAIGSRLAGPVCGIAAVMILFVHRPLLFDHGLRSNNMEASLVLCYCGGMFHYLGWAAARAERWRRRHAVIAGLYFVLGFMTKFVAALFLPLVMVVATLTFRAPRARLAREWRLWSLVGALALALAAPWFIYANLRFGSNFWHIMLGEHVYTRFTTYLDPAHVQPWSFYLTELYRWFRASDSHLVVSGGLALLIVQTIRRRWLEGAVVLFWLALPMLLMSVGTSKLYHYTYPFLPPLALAGGYLVAFIVSLAPTLARGLQTLGGSITDRIPSMATIPRRPDVRAALLAIAGAATLVAAITVFSGPIRIAFGRAVVFRSTGVLRPLIVVAFFGALSGESRHASRIVVALLAASLLPLQTYRETLPRLAVERHSMRDASDCLVRLEAQMAGPGPGLYVDASDRYVTHPLYYYFRRVRPVTRVQSGDLGAIARYLYNPAEWRPLLVWDSTYQDFMNTRAATGPRAASPPMVAFTDVLLLLPGPYARCSAAAADRPTVR